MSDHIASKIIGGLKTLYTNWRDLIAIIISLIVIYVLLEWVDAKNVPTILPDGTAEPSKWGFLYDLAKYIQVLAAFTIAVCFPWIPMALTFPKTIGDFINNDFNDSWKCIGASKVDVAGWSLRTIPHAKAVLLESKLKLTLAIYCVFIIVEVLAWQAVQ